MSLENPFQNPAAEQPAESQDNAYESKEEEKFTSFASRLREKYGINTGKIDTHSAWSEDLFRFGLHPGEEFRIIPDNLKESEFQHPSYNDGKPYMKHKFPQGIAGALIRDYLSNIGDEVRSKLGIDDYIDGCTPGDIVARLKAVDPATGEERYKYLSAFMTESWDNGYDVTVYDQGGERGDRMWDEIEEWNKRSVEYSANDLPEDLPSEERTPEAVAEMLKAYQLDNDKKVLQELAALRQ